MCDCECVRACVFRIHCMHVLTFALICNVTQTHIPHSKYEMFAIFMMKMTTMQSQMQTKCFVGNRFFFVAVFGFAFVRSVCNICYGYSSDGDPFFGTVLIYLLTHRHRTERGAQLWWHSQCRHFKQFLRPI